MSFIVAGRGIFLIGVNTCMSSIETVNIYDLAKVATVVVMGPFFLLLVPNDRIHMESLMSYTE